MTQDKINQAEWEDPKNWTAATGIAVYFSKADTRAWVPKREPWQGTTLNLGTKNGVRWLYGLFGSVVLISNLVWIIAFVLTGGLR